MGRCPLAPRIHRGASSEFKLSEHMNGWQVALGSVSVEQDSIKSQLSDNLCVHPRAIRDSVLRLCGAYRRRGILVFTYETFRCSSQRTTRLSLS